MTYRQRAAKVIKVEYTPAEYWHVGANFGFSVLRTNAQTAVPALLEIANQNISHSSQIYAILSLASIGPPAKQAVPYLLQWATNTDREVRREARFALLRIDPEAAAKAEVQP